LVAIVGAYLCWRASRSGRPAGAPALDYAPWFLGGAAAVLLATLKEGTFGSVFQVAEPAVALLAAYGATWALRAGPAAEAAWQGTATNVAWGRRADAQSSDATRPHRPVARHFSAPEGSPLAGSACDLSRRPPAIALALPVPLPVS